MQINSEIATNETTNSTSAEDFPEFVLEEVALFLSVSEAQRAMASVCRRWHLIFSESVLLTKRQICFREFGCDPILPPRCSWNEWIEQLRALVDVSVGAPGGTQTPPSSSNQLVLRGYHPRFILFPRHFWYPRRSLHSGFVILPHDFRFRFSSSYSSPSYLADLQRIIDERRSEISQELAILFTVDGADGRRGESRRREMIEKVICLRTLASEQIELEVICRRHAHGLSLRRAREIDLEYRRDQTSMAKVELARVRDDLEKAVRGCADPVTAISVADDKMLSLLPPGDMCGNDKARCEELRRACRALITKLEKQIEKNASAGRDGGADTEPLSIALFVRKRKRTAIKRSLEEIKKTTVDSLEALIQRHDGDFDDCEGRRLKAQIERALRDVTHWKE